MISSCQTIQNSPYMLEVIVQNLDQEQSSAVRLALLNAAVRLFFKRPPEFQNIVGTIFYHLIGKVSNGIQFQWYLSILNILLVVHNSKSTVGTSVRQAPCQILYVTDCVIVQSTLHFVFTSEYHRCSNFK